MKRALIILFFFPLLLWAETPQSHFSHEAEVAIPAQATTSLGNESLVESSEDKASNKSVTLVYLVRHAEKLAGRDPDLSQAGLARVAKLKTFFEKIAIDGFYASHLKRAIQTIEPIAAARGQKITVIQNGDPKETVAQVKARRGETLVISGHSNTVPDMIKLLGGPALTITEMEYSNLFLVVLYDGHSHFQQFQLDP